MPLFDECCVLIPASTLEDFPSDLPDDEARSLLAAWTVLWDPELLAEIGQLPVWYRADTPPEDLERRLITSPLPSLAQLPEGYSSRARNCPSCLWIEGQTRSEMIAQLPDDWAKPAPLEQLVCGGRIIERGDFFAVGYAVLQIQVMTRRLRYTSNLDEIHLQNRVIAAAQAFVGGDAMETNQALHDVFDCLAEERDHYFSSDPHLIDLTLTSCSTIDKILDLTRSECNSPANAEQDAPHVAGPIGQHQTVNTPSSDQTTPDSLATDSQATDSPEPVASERGSGTEGESSDIEQPLPTPRNLLIDGDVAAAIGNLDGSRTEPLRSGLANGEIGWAGGGPATSVCLDEMTFAQAEAVFQDAFSSTRDALGTAPQVYGRFAGATPSDLTSTLARLGYCGMIPIDFAGGSGFGDEAKVIMQAGTTQLEALTAKPIDAARDASFLNLGTRLGEAIDSGEIATGLLAHWPGESCEAFDDLRRVARWSLCLGRFWKLADYFREGEHPYHHGTATTSSPGAADRLTSLVDANESDPLSKIASAFCDSVRDEQRSILAGMRDLVDGRCDESQELADPIEGLARAIGATLSAGSGESDAKLLINSNSVGVRTETSITGCPPNKSDHLYATTSEDGRFKTTVDIPGCGFVILQGDPGGTQASEGMVRQWRNKLFGGPKPIAEGNRLQNEFMEVAVNAESGAVSGVYSGGTRGNRFSFRLVRTGLGDDSTIMHADRVEIISSSPSVGCVQTSGTIRATNESDAPVLANYRLRYTLLRGSRFLQVDGEIEPKSPISGAPWTHYFAARSAFASDSPICRALLRDKSHRVTSRRIVSPLGVVVDEAERVTLVTGQGLPFHRRVGERFLDTLVGVQGETQKTFTLNYGFDVPAPVATARARIAPCAERSVDRTNATPAIGWILHAAPKDLVVSEFSVHPRADGCLAALVRVIQTQPRTCKAAVRFYRDVKVAALVDGTRETVMNLTLEDLVNQPTGQRGDLKHAGDRVTFSLPSHGVADLLVVFESPAAESPPTRR